MTVEQPKQTERPTFYSRWLSPEGYLGLHLVIGFVIALVAGFIFETIADEVFESPATLAADAAAQQLAAAVASPGLTSVMRLASTIGSPLWLGVLSIGVVAALAWLGSKRRLALFVAVMGVGPVLNVLLKGAYHRARPAGYDEALAHGFSFPSGHSMGSMLFFGALAYVIYFTVKGSRALRAGVAALSLLAVVVIGGSRIYLGVHYFSDVVAGFAAGLCWVAVCVSGVEAWVHWRDWRRKRRGDEGRAEATS